MERMPVSLVFVKKGRINAEPRGVERKDEEKEM